MTQLNKNLYAVTEHLAKFLMFTPNISDHLLQEQIKHVGVVYRKDKSIQHINDAIRLGYKQGMGKTEFEISMVAINLTKVFKLA